VEKEVKTEARAGAERADEWVRRELAPAAVQVARVVHGALRDGAERRVPGPLRWVVPAAGAAVLTLLAAGTVWLVARHGSRAGVPVAAAGGEAGVPVLTNVDGVVELRLPPEPPAVRPPEGGTTVFNRDGLVVAVVTGGAVRYMVIGGGT
jgi:hypothetical protein